MNRVQIIGQMGNTLLQEIHFWQITLNIYEKVLEDEEKLLLTLHNDIVQEIDRIQQDKKRCTH